jgi:hypothetical protein
MAMYVLMGCTLVAGGHEFYFGFGFGFGGKMKRNEKNSTSNKTKQNETIIVIILFVTTRSIKSSSQRKEQRHASMLSLT